MGSVFVIKSASCQRNHLISNLHLFVKFYKNQLITIVEAVHKAKG
jgi:hypothetical protein